MEPQEIKHIKVSADTHKLMKIQAAQKGMTIMEIVECMFRDSLKVKAKK